MKTLVQIVQAALTSLEGKCSETRARDVSRAITNEMLETLGTGDSVYMHDVGSINPIEIPEKTTAYYNVKEKRTVWGAIPAHIKIKFNTSKTVRELKITRPKKE